MEALKTCMSCGKTISEDVDPKAEAFGGPFTLTLAYSLGWKNPFQYQPGTVTKTLDFCFTCTANALEQINILEQIFTPHEN